MIPQFPQFKKLALADRSDIDLHTNSYEPYSDFNFTCLWAWDTAEARMVSELNGNLVVRFTDYMTDDPFLSFLGRNDQTETTTTLIDYCKKNGLPTTLRLIPPVSIDGLDPSTFMITESQGDFDYIFSAEKLSQLAGTEFYTKRRYASRFWREHPLARVVRLDLKNGRVQKDILETVDAWEHHKIQSNKEYHLAHELIATKRLLSSDRLDALIGLGMYIDEIMIGYAIVEVLGRGSAIFHFIKFNVLYRGVNEALMQTVAIELKNLSVKFINFESDLGLESMQTSKMSWRPVMFLKRFEIRYAHS